MIQSIREVANQPEEHVLSSPNPYEPPAASEPASSGIGGDAYPTRMRAARAGAWRGAKLGFWTFCIILWTVGLVILLVGALIPAVRSEVIPGTTAVEISLSVGKTLFVLLVIFPLFAVLYGSLPGGLIMGAIAAIRWRRPTDFNNCTTLVL
jgi:hypothetical protein